MRPLGAAFMGPIVGPLIDKFGSKWLMFFSAIIGGIATIAVAEVTEIWQFYVVYGIAGALTFTGVGDLVATAVIPKWFIRKRGSVLGLAAMGPGFGPMIFPVSIQALINMADWRTAWLVLGVVTIAILVPLSLLVRTRPEDMGLLPDGDMVPYTNTGNSVEINKTDPQIVEGLTRKESLHTTSFWLIVGSFMLVGLGMGGFHANLVPYFQDTGFTAAVAALSGTAFAISSVTFRPLWGILAERIPVRYLIGPLLIVAAGTVLLLLNVDGKTSMLIASGVHGVAIGAYITLQGIVVADYFGRAHLGAINGIMRPFMTGAAALSPLLIALLFDLHNSYTLAFFIVAIVWALAGGMISMAVPPIKNIRR